MRSKASKYASKCNDAVHLRVAEYTNQKIKIGDASYSVERLVYNNASEDTEELLNEIIKGCLNDDNATNRMHLREMELIYLAANS